MALDGDESMLDVEPDEEQSEQLEQPEHALADPVAAAPAEPVAAPRVMLSALPDAELFAILRGLQLTQRDLVEAPFDHSAGAYMVRLSMGESAAGYSVAGLSASVLFGRGAPGAAANIGYVCNEEFSDDEISNIAQRMRTGELADVEEARARELVSKPRRFGTREAALAAWADVYTAREAALAVREAALAVREVAVAAREVALAAREADEIGVVV